MGKEVVRQDVIQVSFDIDNNPLTKIQKELNKLKGIVDNALGDDTFQDFNKGTTKAADGLDDIKKSADNLKSSKPLDDMADGAKKAAEGVDKLKDNAEGLKTPLESSSKSSDKLKGSLKGVSAISMTQINNGIDKIGKGLTTAAKKATGVAYTSLKKLASLSFKGLIAGVGGVTAIIAKSVSEYANYEQQIGGVETLFKKNADIVQKNANNAYKTAGLSANAYMETVTGFSASLLQSLDGDTKKAASYADLAITDMADNANKMGTSMDSIQQTYQGFAKQNYTMLDNLKLGYGGTKTEMERLVKDAAKIDKSVKANDMSFGNIVKAIHAVQTNLDITGTTSKEASSTISGSLASMKSAWGNLTTAFITGGDSLDQCIDNMVSSVKIFAKNVIPAAKKALSGFGNLIEELSPMIAKELPSVLKELLPQLIKSGTTILNGFIQAIVKVLPSVLPVLASGVVQLMVGIGKTIVSNAGQLLNAAKETAAEVVKALYEGITGQPMGEEAFSNVKNTIDSVFSSVQKIATGVFQFAQQLSTVLAPVLAFIGTLALNVFGWIADNINWLLPLVTALVGAFLAYKAALVVVNVITTIVTTAQSIMAAVTGTASAAAASGTAAVGASAAASVPQILAFAAAIFAVGAAILMICIGFALLVNSSIALANAGWGAIAVMTGLIVVIAALAVGAAVLGTALTAGAVGFVAFGAAVLMVGAGFALIGAGALMAANALKIVALVLPLVAAYGLQSSGALITLGAGLLVFAAGALVAGAAALVLGAGLLVVAAALVVIAASVTVISTMFLLLVSSVVIFRAAIQALPALFSLIVPQMLAFATSLTPLTTALVAAVVPLVAFTAAVAILAVSFTLLAATSVIFLVALTGIFAIITMIGVMITLLNAQLTMLNGMFLMLSQTSMIVITAITPLAAVFTMLVVPVLLFAAAITPLTVLFTILAASALIFLASLTALLVIITLVTAMLTMMSAVLMTIPVVMMMITTFSMLMTQGFMMLLPIMTALTPIMLMFTAALLPLAGTFALVMAAALIFTGSMAALMVVMVVLAPLSMIFALAMAMLNPIFTSLSKSVPKVSNALEPLAGRFGALIIPVGLLVIALAPLSAEFAVLAAAAVVTLAAMTGLVATTMMLSVLFKSIVSVSKGLVVSFGIIGSSAAILTTMLAPLTKTLLGMCAPLIVVTASYTVFAATLLIVVAAVKVINSSFKGMAALLTIITTLLAVMLGLLKSVSNTFEEVAKTPDLFNTSLSKMVSQGITSTTMFITVLKQFATMAKLIVATLAKDISSTVDNSIIELVKKITQLPVKMGDGLKSSSKSLSDSLVSVWKDAVKASVAPVNKVIDGANWILKQFGSNKKVVSWTPYANGTNGHKGGNALVNDGNGAELIQMPNGNTFIPQGKNVFIPNAPKGMKVLPAEQTAALMGSGSPAYRYANGTGDIDIWSYIDSPADLISKVASQYVNYDGMSGFALNAGKAMVSTVTGEMTSWAKSLFDEYGAKSIANYVSSAGVEQWRSTVIQALKMTGQYTEANVKRTLYQMQTESGGNPRAINLWDSNAKKGIPSKGLMQCIDPTFKAYAMAGHNTNIYDPLSNILASIRYAVSRYGSLAKAYQGHGYANGGIANKPSIFGEDGSEMAIPLSKSKRKQSVGLWEQTGSLLGIGLDEYTPENTVTDKSTTNQYNNYSPQFTLNMNGTSDESTNKRKVMQWVKQGMQECFESIGRTNNIDLQEV